MNFRQHYGGIISISFLPIAMTVLLALCIFEEMTDVLLNEEVIGVRIPRDGPGVLTPPAAQRASFLWVYKIPERSHST